MNNAQKFFDETLIKLAKQYEKKNFSKESVKVIIIKLPKNELLVEPKFTLEKEGYSENKNNEYKN